MSLHFFFSLSALPENIPITRNIDTSQGGHSNAMEFLRKFEKKPEVWKMKTNEDLSDSYVFVSFIEVKENFCFNFAFLTYGGSFYLQFL